MHSANHPGAKLERKDPAAARNKGKKGVMATAMAFNTATYPHVVKTPGVCGGKAASTARGSV